MSQDNHHAVAQASNPTDGLGQIPVDAGEELDSPPPPPKKPSRMSSTFLLRIGGTLVLAVAAFGYFYLTGRSTTMTIKKQPVPPSPIQAGNTSATGGVAQQIRQSSQSALANQVGSSAAPTTPKTGDKLSQALSGGLTQTLGPPASQNGQGMGSKPPDNPNGFPGGQPLNPVNPDLARFAGNLPPGVVPQPAAFHSKNTLQQLEETMKKDSFVYIAEGRAQPATETRNPQGAKSAITPGTEIQAVINHKVFNVPNTLVVAQITEPVPDAPLLTTGSKIFGTVVVEREQPREKRIYVQFYAAVLADGTQLPIHAVAWDNGHGLAAKQSKEWGKVLGPVVKGIARDAMSLLPVVGSRVASSAGLIDYGSNSYYDQYNNGYSLGGNNKSAPPLYFPGGTIKIYFIEVPEPQPNRKATAPVTLQPPIFQPPQAPNQAWTFPPVQQPVQQFPQPGIPNPNGWVPPQPIPGQPQPTQNPWPR